MNKRKLLSLLNTARVLSIRAEEAVNAVFAYLDQCGVVVEGVLPNACACNSDDLAQAISCYVDYGESTAEAIVEDCAAISKGGADAV